MGSTGARYRDALARCRDSSMCRFRTAAVLHDVSLLEVLCLRLEVLCLWVA